MGDIFKVLIVETKQNKTKTLALEFITLYLEKITFKNKGQVNY